MHPPDDLIVGHIAIKVDGSKMDELRERLASMGILFRKNVSVPNPASGTSPVDQVDKIVCPMSLYSLCIWCSPNFIFGPPPSSSGCYY